MYPYDILFDMSMYSICFLVGVLFALFFVNYAIERRGFSLGLQRLVLIGGFSAVALGYGSAILFQAFYDFLATGIFKLDGTTGATFFGGLIGGVFVFVLFWFLLGKKFCKDKTEPKNRFPDMLDMAAACVPVAHGFGRLGCFFAGCCHGAKTDAWYGVMMYIEKAGGGKEWAKVVPIQLFEAIFLFLLGAALLFLYFTRRREKRLPLMSFYAFFYGVWRYVIEFFRTDDRGDTLLPFMTPSQLTAALLILFGGAYFILWLLKRKGVFAKQADKRAFKRIFGQKPTGRYCASGRINILGEHIDYCGGKVLPAALGLKCYVYGAANGLDEIRLFFEGMESPVCLPLADLLSCKTLPVGNYQAGVAHELQKAGVNLVGCDLYYRCEVPFGGALSSSAAIEVSTALALLDLSGESLDKREIALLCQRAENEFVGVNCGIMDQYVAAFGKKDNALLLDCGAVSHEEVPVSLNGYTFLLANCNRPHSLKESKYNERRAETEKALKIVQKKKPVEALASLTVDEVKSFEKSMPREVYARVLHVAAENARVQRAVEALKEGDMLTLGALLDASHDSLRRLYEVSCEETDTLQESFRKRKGCVGARMIGGGFGGCVLALVKTSQADRCEQRVKEEYAKRIGYAPTFYPVLLSDGTAVEKLDR
ncbi:MAG: galactokinase [Clostridia bacterium]|nr:galactokinase [Clostridia bacterium]